MSFADLLRIELAAAGIGVSVVLPAGVTTDFSLLTEFHPFADIPDRSRLRPAHLVTRGIDSDKPRAVIAGRLSIATLQAGRRCPHAYHHLAIHFG